MTSPKRSLSRLAESPLPPKVFFHPAYGCAGRLRGRAHRCGRFLPPPALHFRSAGAPAGALPPAVAGRRALAVRGTVGAGGATTCTPWPAGHAFGGNSWRACPNRLFKQNSLAIRLFRVIHICEQSTGCRGRSGKFPGPFGWDCWHTFLE